MNIKILRAVVLIFFISTLSIISVGCSNDKKEKVSSTIIENDEKHSNDSNKPETDNTESGGGNPDKSNVITYKITVSGNEYIYDNKNITLEDLIKIIEKLDENSVVEVYDDSASEKAYKSLIDYSALWKTPIRLKENIDTRRGKRQFEPGTH